LTESLNIFKKILLFLGFFLANFGALALGGLLMGGSPAQNDWYVSLNKAPWTPPGWVFGFAWTFIMICFTIYMFKVVQIKKSLNFTITLFLVQWVLNVAWNPLFFYYHLPILALICLGILLISILFLLTLQEVGISLKTLLFPYIFWLAIAFSMNLFIIIEN
jgi:benzodiazapine receptor